MGHLTLIIGCMYAQKTTELIRRARLMKVTHKTLIINHSSDTRFGNNCLGSHDKDIEMAIHINLLEEVSDIVKNYQVILIDEGQFFLDLFKYVTLWSDTLDVTIIVAGLSGDSNRRPIGDILQLIPYAEEIQHATAQCAKCESRAIYSKFIGNGTPGIGTDYIPVCRKHF